MKVRLAKTAGFCMGVRRAMDIVLETANKARGPVRTEGPLIHNRQVLELLEARGVSELGEEPDLSDTTVVVRAHGITPARRKELKQRGANIRDATCPHVARVQAIVKKATVQGRAAVIVGDPGHGEVVGIQGFATSGGFVIQSPEQVDELPDLDAVSVVAQTTQHRETYESVVRQLKARYADCEVHDTICDATSDRQQEAIELANELDAMVIVGGRDSANTQRLVELGKATGTPTFHVETDDELDLAALRHFGQVGVTAGASTPTWLIARTIEGLHSVNLDKLPWAARLAGSAFRLLVHTNLYVAAGALAMTYANCRLMGVAPHALPWIAFLYVFSMQTLNMIVDKKAESLNDPGRGRFVSRHETMMLASSIGSTALAIVASAFLAGWAAFALIVVASALGGVYRIRFIPRLLQAWFSVSRLFDLPGTREIFITGAWAVSTAFIPALAGHAELEPSLAVAFCFTGAMVFLRTIVLDIRDFQGDQVVGRETLPTFFGLGVSKVLVVCGIVAVGGVMVWAPRVGWAPDVCYPLLACLAYAGTYLLLYHLRVVTARLAVEGTVDANFLLAGLIALIW